MVVAGGYYSFSFFPAWPPPMSLPRPKEGCFGRFFALFHSFQEVIIPMAGALFEFLFRIGIKSLQPSFQFFLGTLFFFEMCLFRGLPLRVFSGILRVIPSFQAARIDLPFVSFLPAYYEAS